MKPAIRVENLSKQYRIGMRTRAASRNLTESIVEGASALWRGLAGRTCHSDGAGEFWALKNISFNVQPGEVVGIIGHNGAGKSTLLKVLSRIAEPTSGRAEVRGRMASLLEVGTGFHPELTGRENVYLNGSILGMSRREIAQRFDAIVAFADIEQLLDTPVKRYSSGMYVRLAFAVAAHLQPEILIVDEVLAVGDATFQRRCAQRMEELARDGRTVIFVSHNMDLLPRLCQRALLLEKGKLAEEGPAADIVHLYLEKSGSIASGEYLEGHHRMGDDRARFVRWWLERHDGNKAAVHRAGDDLILCVEIEARSNIHDAALAIVLRTLSGTRLITSWTREAGYHVDLTPGKHTYRCIFKQVAVRPGHRLAVMLWMEAGEVVDSVDDAGVIEVIDGQGTERLSTDTNQGIIVFEYTWEQAD